MPRRRNPENAGLPRRWQHTHGAYYYQVPPGLEALWDGKRKFRLGKSLPEAYRTWADRLGQQDAASTVRDLLERYALEVVPTKAPKSRTENARYITKLIAVFGALPLAAITPQMVYQYVDRRSRKDDKGHGGRIVAHRETEVLSHAYTKAVEWGYIARHPFKGEVRLQGEKSRDRYVEDWEVIEALALESRRKKGSVLAIQAYIRIKLMTGLSRSDLLRLTAANLRDDGIHIQRHKTAHSTGKRTIYEWTPELRTAVETAKSVRPALSPFLFCRRTGAGYFDEETGECHGWDSMWQRFMARVLDETEVKERFTEHDLRAKCASDAESLERARALLSHADSRTTNRIYRRRAEVVKPAKGVG
ncbi:site-specific integrase [Pseudothauera rhizosphaerae]|uniref:Integrase n=1 Tax=Pseudothauera rhizosphaerae TaxID=2565932 RepID=A0A4V3WBS5_9RHOO|nr:tyrosine-type recombinase/integrase [Pseudothauera rhizosphaerae]THF64356.1 integrase [Pseudothauera rhizosphaerae]